MGAGKLSVSGEKTGWDLLCSTSSLHVEANPYKSCHNCSLWKKEKKKIKVELWCLCCLFFPECGIYFLILLPCRWRKSLCTERSLSFEPQPLCLAKCNCMKFLNQIFPENVKSAPSPVISLLTRVFCGGWKAACKVHCSIPRFHGSDIWVWSWNAIKESCAGAASFSQEKKKSFNSENGGVDEFERVFSPVCFQTCPPQSSIPAVSGS